MTLKSYRPKPTCQQEQWSRPSTSGLLACVRPAVLGEGATPRVQAALVHLCPPIWGQVVFLVKLWTFKTC